MKISEAMSTANFEGIFKCLLKIGATADEYTLYKNVYTNMCKPTKSETTMSVKVKNTYDVIGVDKGKEMYLYYCLFSEWGAFNCCSSSNIKEKYLACILFEATYISFKDEEILDEFIGLMSKNK